ncbi:hypothetical protein NKI36_29745 [Mesorhizobium caraganae]|uniref:Uncharacterized protein n=1 Tax=Mesorhizobium caraganae TaxID=483206 RepID=A0ABV1Z8A3_9HYPH
MPAVQCLPSGTLLEQTDELAALISDTLVEFVESKKLSVADQNLVYFEGSQLYYDYYSDKDHLEVAQTVKS